MRSTASPPSFPETARDWVVSHRVALSAVGIALAALLAYVNSFSGPFVFDDLLSIPYNRSIRHLWPFWEVLLPRDEDGATVNGRPVINLTFALNYACGGLDVRGYHVVNLLVHILSGVTLLGVIRRTLLQPVLRARFGDAALLLAFVSALLWTLHPLQTESVTYIVQRCESLMGLFYLLMLYAFIRATELEGNSRWLLCSVATCFLGAATKEVMISAPLVILLYDRTFVAGTFLKALARHKGYYAALACIWPLIAWMMMRAGTRAHTVGDVPGLAPGIYALNQFHSIVHYLALSVWPYPQVFDYGPPTISSLGEVWFEAVIVLALAAGTAYALRRAPTPENRWPVLGFLGAWFFLILAPSSSFIPIKDVMFEHRMYLPLAAIIVLIVTGVYAWVGWRGAAALLVLAPVCVALTWVRNDDYRSLVSIWADTAAKRPLSERAHENLAYALAEAGRTDEALAHYQEALKLNPNDSTAHSNLGGFLVQMGRFSEGMDEYRIALEIDPNNGAAHTNRGVVLSQTGHTDEAAREFEKALEIDHRDAEAHNNLGAIYAGEGRTEEAFRQYEEAVEINPNYIDAYANLGSALGGMGKMAEAAEQYREILRIDPQSIDGHYGLGVALTGLGRIREAEEQYEEILKIDPQNAKAKNNLAWLRSKYPGAENTGASP